MSCQVWHYMTGKNCLGIYLDIIFARMVSHKAPSGHSLLSTCWDFIILMLLHAGRFFWGVGVAFLLTVGAFLLTVELLCLQSLLALIRRIFRL